MAGCLPERSAGGPTGRSAAIVAVSPGGLPQPRPGSQRALPVGYARRALLKSLPARSSHFCAAYLRGTVVAPDAVRRSPPFFRNLWQVRHRWASQNHLRSVPPQSTGSGTVPALTGVHLRVSQGGFATPRGRHLWALEDHRRPDCYGRWWIPGRSAGRPPPRGEGADLIFASGKVLGPSRARVAPLPRRCAPTLDRPGHAPFSKRGLGVSKLSTPALFSRVPRPGRAAGSRG
jgi:hypothetical protein